MNKPFPSAVSFPAAVLLAGALLLLSSQPLAAQARAGNNKREQQLEQRIANLENQVALLQERLEAIAGPSPDLKVYDLPVGGSPVMGSPDAAVTLVIFGDYQSDYTVRAHYVLLRLLETYPEQLRIVHKHYPLNNLHPLASESAKAVMAAHKQGRFREMHELLLRNSRQLKPATLLILAEQAGLDLNRFDADRRSLWALEVLTADEKLAAQSGIEGVPVVFLNGRRMSTWRYDFLKSQIEKVLPRQ